MRKSLWIILTAVFVAVGAPRAQADSFTATFTCSGTCLSTPSVSNNPVTFPPAPTVLDITWDSMSITLSIPQSSGATLGDTFGWAACSSQFSECGITYNGVLYLLFPDSFTIVDLTFPNYSHQSISVVYPSTFTTFDSGMLTFTPAAVPEPSTFSLVLIGFGSLALMLAMGKRIARGLSQAV